MSLASRLILPVCAVSYMFHKFGGITWSEEDTTTSTSRLCFSVVTFSLGLCWQLHWLSVVKGNPFGSPSSVMARLPEAFCTSVLTQCTGIVQNLFGLVYLLSVFFFVSVKASQVCTLCPCNFLDCEDLFEIVAKR